MNHWSKLRPLSEIKRTPHSKGKHSSLTTHLPRIPPQEKQTEEAWLLSTSERELQLAGGHTILKRHPVLRIVTHLPKDSSDVSIALSRENALSNVFVVARLAGIFPLADPAVGNSVGSRGSSIHPG